MKRSATLITLVLTLLVASCGGDSKFPIATGKASIRAINAIKTSPNVVFRIEERSIDDVAYQNSSALTEYDNLDYTFNFDVTFAGEASPRRIASQHIDFIDGQEYTLILSGSVANPALTLWEIDQREFSTDATVLQLRFAHTSEFLSATDLDFYLAPAGVVPAVGNELATVAFGELSAPVDVEADDLILTITAAGNPGDIRYTSTEVTLSAATNLIISPFDATPSRTTEFSVHIIGLQAGTTELADNSAQTTVQFLHASSDLGVVHIYDDEMLTSQVLADHMYTDFSPEIPISPGAITYRYTPTDTSAVLVEGDMQAFAGGKFRFIVSGANADYSATALLPDIRPVETSARLLIAQASSNFIYMEFYLVDSGELVDDTNRLERILTASFPNVAAAMPAGDYDIYVTAADPTDILAGPIALTVAIGDVVDIMIFDDPADTSVLDLQFLSGT